MERAWKTSLKFRQTYPRTKKNYYYYPHRRTCSTFKRCIPTYRGGQLTEEADSDLEEANSNSEEIDSEQVDSDSEEADSDTDGNLTYTRKICLNSQETSPKSEELSQSQKRLIFKLSKTLSCQPSNLVPNRSLVFAAHSPSQ